MLIQSTQITLPIRHGCEDRGVSSTCVLAVQSTALAPLAIYFADNAAGDCITPHKVVAGAISSGCNAAMGASTQLFAQKYGHHPKFQA